MREADLHWDRGRSASGTARGAAVDSRGGRSAARSAATRARRAGGNGPHRADHPRRRVVVREGDRHPVPDGHTGQLGSAQRQLHLAARRGGQQHRLIGPGMASERDRHARHAYRSGFEHHPTGGQRAGQRVTKGVLELLHGGGRGRPEEARPMVKLSARGVTKGDQVRVQLGHVGSGSPSRQNAVDRSGAVQQHHGTAVHPVEDPALTDHLPIAGRCVNVPRA